MLTYLGLKASDRKLRLFAVACCRRRWKQLRNEQLRLCIETAELFADGQVSQKQRGSVFAAAKGPGVTMKTSPPYDVDLTSAKTMIEWESNGHNGGAVCFGTDGMMYVTSGDGTSDSDTNLTGQRPDLLLAKVLRIPAGVYLNI